MLSLFDYSVVAERKLAARGVDRTAMDTLDRGSNVHETITGA